MSEPTFEDELSPDAEDEDPVFVLWEGGSIETFKNDDDAREELMTMGSRGCQGMKFSSMEEAEGVRASMAASHERSQQ